MKHFARDLFLCCAGDGILDFVDEKCDIIGTKDQCFASQQHCVQGSSVLQGTHTAGGYADDVRI